MSRGPVNRGWRACFTGILCLLAVELLAQESRTVVGASNQALQEGADALMAGDAEEGVRLTLIGLKRANSTRERHTALSNLCAGYALLGQYEKGLGYCNDALAENDRLWRAYSNRALIYINLKRYPEAEQDLLKGEAIAPTARKLRQVREMYLDATQPVSPNVVIDDRQRAPRELTPGEGSDAD